MRRKDREISFEDGLEIIDKSDFGVISCIDDDKIFSIPISIVRDEMSIFIHGANDGSKSRLFQNGKDVVLTCAIDVKVPAFSDDEIYKAIVDNRASSIFTTEFKSAVVNTKAYEITDINQKIHVLKILSQKYTPNYMSAFDAAIKQSLKHTRIYELKIINLSAKAKILRH
jgi:putative nitroimidazole resistance protein